MSESPSKDAQEDSAQFKVVRRFRHLVDGLPMIVWTANAHGEVDYSNRCFFEFSGVAPDAAPATRWQPTVHPADLPHVLKVWMECVRTGEKYDIEFRMRRVADGEYRWFRVQAVPVREADGKVFAWYGVALEIHETKERLRLLDACLTSMQELVLVTEAEPLDEPGPRIVMVNPAFEEMTGYTREEVLGKSPRFLQGPGTSPATRKRIREALKKWQPVREEILNYKKTGEEFWLELNIVPVADERGRFTHWISIERDVTERKKQDEALRESEERMRLLSRATSDAIWDWDIVSGTLWWNEGVETLFGLNREQLEPDLTSWTTRIHPADKQRVIASLQAVVDGTENNWRCEYRFECKDGTYAYVVDRGYVIRSAEGKATRMVGGIADLTERRKLEHQVLRAQRLESIGTLAAGIAHDLNNLLAPIVMGIGMLKELGPDPQTGRIIESMDRSAARGVDLVKQILSFARRSDANRSSLLPSEIVRELEFMIGNSFPKNISCKVEVADDAWTIDADATQINQVLLNLCVNARDAMPSGGLLNISVENVHMDASQVLLQPGAEIGRYVVFLVVDTGHGMTDEVLDRAFEPFYTTKEQTQGTGLGLSSAMSIVQSHGGFIHAYSEPGRGSIFKVYLPAAGKQPEQPPAVVPGNSAAGRGVIVLVVDDEEPILEVAGQVLERAGYRVLRAEDGTKGLDLYATHLSEVGVVVTDMMMPVMDGEAFVRALRVLDPCARIVTTSGLGASATMRIGGEGLRFLSKPYTANELLAAVECALSAPQEGD